MAILLQTSDVESYLNKKFDTYSEFKNQIPSKCDYFSISFKKSTADQSLYSIDEILGKDSPIKYNRIIDFPLFDLELSQEINTSADPEELFNAEITGSATIVKPTVQPYEDDLLILKNSDDKFLLFRVTNVNRNRISLDSTYKIEFYKYKILSEEELNELVNNSTEYIVSSTLSELNGRMEYVQLDINLKIEEHIKNFKSIRSKYTKLFFCNFFNSVRYFINRKTKREDHILKYFIDFNLIKFLNETNVLNQYLDFRENYQLNTDIIDYETIDKIDYEVNLYNKNININTDYLFFEEVVSPINAYNINENPFKDSYSEITYQFPFSKDLFLFDNTLISNEKGIFNSDILKILDSNFDTSSLNIDNKYINIYKDFLQEDFTLDITNLNIKECKEDFLFIPILLFNIFKKIENLILENNKTLV